MPLIDMNYDEFKRQKEREDNDLENWEKEMKRSGRLKKCKCGNHYTWGHLQEDPKMCPQCRGDEGELIF